MSFASSLLVKTGTNDPNSKDYLCFAPSVKSVCIERVCAKGLGLLTKFKIFLSQILDEEMRLAGFSGI